MLKVEFLYVNLNSRNSYKNRKSEMSEYYTRELNFLISCSQVYQFLAYELHNSAVHVDCFIFTSFMMTHGTAFLQH